jgi:predicted DsbA family dithiol-disulfide isomerase
VTAGAPEGQASMARAVVAGAPETGSGFGATVRFVADLVCPWCYLSFRRLRPLLMPRDAALIWHPFLLNPHLPPGGVPRRRYLERKFGNLAQAERVHRRVQEVGAHEGVRFAFGTIRTQPSTVLAHALVLGAADGGVEAMLHAADLLFRAFLERGADIGAPDVLRDLARAAALPARAVAALDDPRQHAAVLAAHTQACGLGINGVPICVFGADHVIAGAQPVEALAALLDLERYRAATAAAAG